MTRNSKIRLLFAFFSIMIANSALSLTYYSKSGTDPSVPSGWNTAPNGSGANAVNFTTPGDIFILQSGQTQKIDGDLIIGSGVTLRLIGSIQFQKKASDKIIIRGTVVFTSNTSQITIVNGAGNSDHEFTLADGATLITSNYRGIHGIQNASIHNSARITVNLSTSADYEFNGANQILYGLPSTVRNLCFSGTGTKSARASYAITQDLSIEPGATFSAANYNHNLHGNWINNGGFSADNSTVTFSSADAQYIRGSSVTSFNNLTIAKGGTSAVFLEVNSSVEGTISLINGYLDIADYSLFAENTSGGSSGSYIRTSGTGRLKRNVAAGETKDFPVGNAAYNPAGITNEQTSGTDAFNIRVTDDPISNSNDVTRTVNRRWYLTKDAAGTTSITAYLTYNTGEQQAGFNSAVNPFIGAFVGTLWAYAPASVSGNTLSASGAVPQLVDDAFLAIGSGDAFTASKFAVSVSPYNPVVGMANGIITVRSVNSVGIPTLVATPTNFILTSITTFNGTTTGTIPAQNFEYQFTNIQFTTVFTDATVTATRADNSGELLNPGTSDLFNVVAGTIWEPVTTGNWNAVSWRSSSDGGFVWINPATRPANNVFGETDLIYIPAGISLAANVNASFYRMIIEGSLDLRNGATLTLSHVTTDDDYNVHVHGTFKNSGGTFVNSNELQPIEIHGGTYEHARDGGSIPNAEWYTIETYLSTCKVTGITGSPLSSGLDQNFQNFIWDNPGQTVIQNLHGNITVGNELSLVNGVVTTGDNFVTALATGTITRTNGYISGNFRSYVPDGTDEDIWFPVGDNLSYAPVHIVFNGTTSGSGYLDAFTAVEIPPVASGLSHDRYINRKWSISANGVNFTSFGADFSFTDNDRVGSPLNTSLKLREFAAGTWHSTNGVVTGNTMSVSNLNLHGVFVIGEDDCNTGNAIWFGSVSTDWNTAGNWCSGSVPDSSTDVVIPGGIGRYPVIGPEGASVKDITIESGASLTVSGAYTLDVMGVWNNSGSFTPNNGTVSFTGISLQTISGENTFYNLVINNSTGVSAAGDITVDGNLSLLSANPSAISGTLDMSTFELFMGLNSNTTGSGDVSGIVTRNHIFSGNTPYSFGSFFTTLRFVNTGTKPESVSCRITIGTDPGWLPVSPEIVAPVLRQYSFIQSGGNDKVIMQLRYLESELNGNIESDLVLWHKTSGFNPHEHGKTEYDLSDNWVESGAPLIDYIAGDDFDVHRWSFGKSLSLRNVWLGGISISWKEKDNWSEGHFPGEVRINGGVTEEFFDDNIIIQDATLYQPTLDTVTRFKSIEIEEGANLTVGQNAGNDYYTMRITGAPGVTGTWNNHGTFTPGEGKVIFDGDSIGTPLTIAGETDFYILETGPDTYLQPSSSSIFNMYGNLSVDSLSIIDLFATRNTFNYTGTESRTLINPKGPGDETGYNNLIISNSEGEISFPADLNIIGNFTNNTAGTGLLNTTGSAVNFDDAGRNLVNYIRGTSVTFDTVVFNNPMGIIAETDIIVNGQIELAVDNPPSPGKGVLDMANGSRLNMGANAVTFGIGDVTGIINRTHSFEDHVYYSFGAQNSGVTFVPTTGQVKPSSITLKVTIGTPPDWSSDTDWNGNPGMSDPISRLFELAQTGGSGTRATIRIHYRHDEIPIGIDENKLTVWSRVATGGTPAFIGKEEGKSGHIVSENSITIQDANFTFIPSTLGHFQSTIAPSTTVTSSWNGLINTDWSLSSNWDPTGVPTSSTSVIVPNAAITPYSPQLPASAECKSVLVETGGILNAAAEGSILSLSGADLAWNVASGGIFNANTGTVEFISTEGPVSIDGTTFFHNLKIAAGTTLQPSAGSYTGVSGVFSIDGILSGSTNDNVIEFNGTDQVIPNPEGSTYHDLIIGGTGTKTFPATLYISGDFSNNGIIDALTNSSTVIMCRIDQSHNQIIDGTGATLFNNITIQNGSTTIIRSPQKASGIVLVDGSLNSDGFLTLTSTASKTALIDGTGTGQISGNVTMERYLSSGMGYKYISSPFQSATVNELADDINLATSFSPLYSYNENRYFDSTPLSGWVSYNTTTNILYPLKGYAVNLGSDTASVTIDITGIVNNGSQSVTLYNNDHVYTQGFNLVGNPYPSPIDWNAASGWTKDNIDNSIYFFKANAVDQYGGTYSTYINGNSSDGIFDNIIPSMQGFFVHVSDGSYPVTGTLSMDNDVRITNLTHPSTKSSKTTTPSLLRIVAGYSDNSDSFDPMVLYFDDRATLDFDGQLDALKLLNTDASVTNFYSISENDYNLSISALPVTINGVYSIPLGLKTEKNGEVVFKVNDAKGDFTGKLIILSDVVTGVNQDLKPGSEYKVYLNAGEYKSRFFLNLTDTQTATNEEPSDNGWFTIYANHGTLITDVELSEGHDGILTLYNILGERVYIDKVYETGHYEFNPVVKDGLYIVHFTSGNKSITEKIIIVN